MPAGQELLEFSDALLGPDKNRMDQARLAVEDALGHQGVVAATAIAATFTKNDRLANGAGIPSELRMLRNSREIRHELGLNNFRTAANTIKHYPDEM